MSKPSYPRARRISAVIREVLADELEELSDPRLGLATVTGVEVSPDMKRAVVYIDALEPEHLQDTLKALTAAAPRLRAALSHQIHTKYTPSLEFRVDRGVVEGERIEALLRQIDHPHDG